jgi:DMSO/TMAO reductase YedYZ heme-binding membrane subunit
MSEQFWWHLARATGIVAWAGAVGAVLVGLAIASRIGGREVPASWLLALHRHLGALTLAFTGAHLGALVADSYIELTLLDVVLPFRSTWRPGAVAWGVGALWILALVEATSLLRRRLPARLWRSVHLLSYAGALGASIHLFAAGTDHANLGLRLAPLLVLALAVGFLTYRLLMPRRRGRPRPAPAAA